MRAAGLASSCETRWAAWLCVKRLADVDLGILRKLVDQSAAAVRAKYLQ